MLTTFTIFNGERPNVKQLTEYIEQSAYLCPQILFVLKSDFINGDALSSKLNSKDYRTALFCVPKPYYPIARL